MSEHKEHHVPITKSPFVLEGTLFSVKGNVYLGESIRGAIEKHFLGHYCKGEVTWKNVRVTVELLSDDPALDQWWEDKKA